MAAAKRAKQEIAEGQATVMDSSGSDR